MTLTQPAVFVCPMCQLPVQIGYRIGIDGVTDARRAMNVHMAQHTYVYERGCQS